MIGPERKSSSILASSRRKDETTAALGTTSNEILEGLGKLVVFTVLVRVAVIIVIVAACEAVWKTYVVTVDLIIYLTRTTTFCWDTTIVWKSVVKKIRALRLNSLISLQAI